MEMKIAGNRAEESTGFAMQVDSKAVDQLSK